MHKINSKHFRIKVFEAAYKLLDEGRARDLQTAIGLAVHNMRSDITSELYARLCIYKWKMSEVEEWSGGSNNNKK